MYTAPNTGADQKALEKYFEAIRDGMAGNRTARETYSQIYGAYIEWTGTPLPNPPKHEHAKNKLFRNLGRSWLALEKQERRDRISDLHQMLQAVYPGLNSDLCSWPRWVEVIFPWVLLAQIDQCCLVHDTAYRIALTTPELAYKVRLDWDQLFSQQIKEIAAFVPWYRKANYYAFSKVAYRFVRLGGEDSFQVTQSRLKD